MRSKESQKRPSKWCISMGFRLENGASEILMKWPWFLVNPDSSFFHFFTFLLFFSNPWFSKKVKKFGRKKWHSDTHRGKKFLSFLIWNRYSIWGPPQLPSLQNCSLKKWIKNMLTNMSKNGQQSDQKCVKI